LILSSSCLNSAGQQKKKKKSKDIQTLCAKLLDNINENETDLIESYAKQVPVITIARLLGIPEEMSDQLLKWSNSMVAIYQSSISEEGKDLANKSSKEFFEYIKKYVAIVITGTCFA